jgi:hypothetical protein
MNSIVNLFSANGNDGNRHMVRSIIESIFEINRNILIPTFAIDEYIEEYEPISTGKNYTALIPIINQELTNYRSFIELNEMDTKISDSYIKNYLAANNIPAGVYEGDKAKELNAKIYDFLQSEIEFIINQCSGNIIFFAVRQLELIEGNKKRDYIERGVQNERLMSNTNEEAVKEYYHHGRYTAYVRHIVQTILKVNPKGHKHISREKWKLLLGYTAALLETSYIYESILYSLSDYKITIEEPFYELLYDDLLSRVNEEKLNEDLKISHRDNIQTLVNKLNGMTKQAFSEDNVADSKEVMALRNLYSNFDQKFKNIYGISLINSLTYIDAVESFSIENSDYYPINVMSFDNLYQKFNEIFVGVDKEELRLFIDFFSISFETYRSSDKLISSELMRSPNRLALKPFIRLENNYFVVGNEISSHTHRNWGNYLLEGDLPYSETNEDIKNALIDIHEFKSKRLEYEVERLALECFNKKYVVRGIKKFNKIHSDLPKDPPCGEIDLLCVSEERKIVFVLEAKYLNNQRNRPYDVRQTFNDFFRESKRKGYYHKLVKKRDFVRENINKFLAYFQIEDKYNWEVKMAFVVDQIVYASYSVDYEVDFVLLDSFKDYLNNKDAS